jgi:outer membrane autotransporter protein
MLAGLGVAAQIKNNLQMHVDAAYLTGGAINQSVDVTVGVRYVW